MVLSDERGRTMRVGYASIPTGRRKPHTKLTPNQSAPLLRLYQIEAPKPATTSKGSARHEKMNSDRAPI